MARQAWLGMAGWGKARPVTARSGTAGAATPRLPFSPSVLLWPSDPGLYSGCMIFILQLAAGILLALFVWGLLHPAPYEPPRSYSHDDNPYDPTTW